MAVVFSLRYGDAGGADVSVPMLVVLVCGMVLVEEEFCINCIWMCEHLVMVGVCGVTCSWLKRERHCLEWCV